MTAQESLLPITEVWCVVSFRGEEFGRDSRHAYFLS